MTKHTNRVKHCSKLKDLYTLYVYGDVSAQEETMISEHLKDCQKCANEVDSLRETLNLLNTEPELAIPQNLLDNVESKMYKRIAAESLKSSVRNVFSDIIGRFLPRWSILIPSASAVMLIVGMLIGVYAIGPSQPEKSYSASHLSAHKRIELYNQKEVQRQLEDAVLTRYVEGDDWDAASQFIRIREENPGTSLASVAERELTKINVDLKGGF